MATVRSRHVNTTKIISLLYPLQYHLNHSSSYQITMMACTVLIIKKKKKKINGLFAVQLGVECVILLSLKLVFVNGPVRHIRK